jgi:hypothetical protein
MYTRRSLDGLSWHTILWYYTFNFVGNDCNFNQFAKMYFNMTPNFFFILWYLIRSVCKNLFLCSANCFFLSSSGEWSDQFLVIVIVRFIQENPKNTRNILNSWDEALEQYSTVEFAWTKVNDPFFIWMSADSRLRFLYCISPCTGWKSWFIDPADFAITSLSQKVWTFSW